MHATDREIIAELTRQLEVTTMFLQLDARKLREQGQVEAAKPTESQIASNANLINRVRTFYYNDAIATDDAR